MENRLIELEKENSILKVENDRLKMKIITIKAITGSESTSCFIRLKELMESCNKE